MTYPVSVVALAVILAMWSIFKPWTNYARPLIFMISFGVWLVFTKDMLQASLPLIRQYLN